MASWCNVQVAMTDASENGFIGVAAGFTATVSDFCSIFSKLKAFLYFVRLYYVLLATKPDMKVTEEAMILFKFSGNFCTNSGRKTVFTPNS